MNRLVSIACAALLSAGAALAQTSIRFDGSVFRIVGWKPGNPPADGWGSLFHVAAGTSEDAPPLLGTYSVEEGNLTFRPKWPLGPGLHLIAKFTGTGDKLLPVIQEFNTAKSDGVPSTRVERLYPSSSDIPANALRMYLCFTAPMRRGEAWDHIHLTDSEGHRMEHALLEVELWDPEQKRITVLFDPGRVKRDLAPRNDLGPILEEGKSYSIEVDRDWVDDTGQPLVEGFRKQFRVAAEVRSVIDASKWRITTPKAGTRDPLIVTFPGSLDYALSWPSLWVKGVKGRVSVENHETEWRFTPDANWLPGAGKVTIDQAIEDVSGNRMSRPFESYLGSFGAIGLKKRPPPAISELPFEISK
jgi:hypothetical protein